MSAANDNERKFVPPPHRTRKPGDPIRPLDLSAYLVKRGRTAAMEFSVDETVALGCAVEMLTRRLEQVVHATVGLRLAMRTCNDKALRERLSAIVQRLESATGVPVTDETPTGDDQQ